ncbi:MarR family winged helix-turn-helix transcriptional regulator [Algihabitans albus]|uniref:MarR family winged helix-turn-helix transcriptional regulator n=1 Tax=Algihabitans albus TaxID=2164067 RepID=UPI000E5CA0D8|nr:MarR family transcriptional regulator [Algihabitans albus]
MPRAKAALAEQSAITPNWREGPLQGRPGFLIRRLHQIHTAIFAEECGEEKITPIMYSVLSALAQSGPVDQTTLASAVAIDKTNMADILERLRKRGLIRRRVAPKDRRVRLATLTEEAKSMLDRIDDKAERAHLRTVENLSPREQALFIHYMMRVVTAKGAAGDAPASDDRAEG